MGQIPNIPKLSPLPVQAYTEPTLLYFWAPWCGPCTRMSKTVEDLAAMPEIKGLGKVVVLGVNVDEEASFANYAGVTSIPTLMLHLPGKKPQVLCGDRPPAKVLEWLELQAGAAS